MSKQGFNGKKIDPIFIQVGTKSMAKGMAGDAWLPAKSPLLGVDMSGKIKGINGLIRIILFREKPAGGSAEFEPVPGKDIQSIFRKNGISVRTVFAVRDVNTHTGAADIFIAEMANFANAQAGRIHECDHGFLFQVGDGRNERHNFYFCRYKGKGFIKLAHGELRIIPGYVQHIHDKEAELGNGTVNRAVRKTSGFLKPADISTVVFEGMVGKTAKGEHLPKSVKINVHNGTSYKIK